MKIYNNSRNKKWIHYNVNGVNRKVLVFPFAYYEFPDADENAEINYSSIEEARQRAESKTNYFNNNQIREIVPVVTEHVPTNLYGSHIIYDAYLSGNTGVFAGTNGIYKTDNITGNSYTIKYAAKSNCFCLKKYNEKLISFYGDASAGPLFLQSSDEGDTWEETSLSDVVPNIAFRGISTYQNNIWVCGSGGTIIHSADSGTTWSAQSSTLTTYLYDICFINANQGWACGQSGKVIHTENGGQTWTAQTAGAGTATLLKIYFSDANNGVFCGNNGYIRYTTNAGATWNAATKTPTTTESFLTMFFSDANKGWTTVGSGATYHTENGGQTWTAQTSTGYYTRIVYCINFKDQNEGYIFRIRRGVEQTLDGGATWNDFSLTGNGYCSYIQTDEKVLYLANNYFGISHDYGAAFSAITEYPMWSGSSATMISGYKVNDSMYFVGNNASYRGVFKSTDGGLTWTFKSADNMTSALDFYFLDNSVGYVCGESGKIFKTTDSGETWTSLSSSAVTTQTLFGVYFKDAANGLACGINSAFIRTYDSGNTWSSITSSAFFSYNLAYCHKEGDIGFVLSVDIINNILKILRTDDFGETFYELFRVEDVNVPFSKGTFKKIGKKSYIITCSTHILYTTDEFESLNIFVKAYPTLLLNYVIAEDGAYKFPVYANDPDPHTLHFGEGFRKY